MTKRNIITVKDTNIQTMSKDGVDYICITDIAKQRNPIDSNGVIANWMHNRNTIEFLGLWETLYNQNSTPLEFEGGRRNAGLNDFTLSPTQWITATNAIGCGRGERVCDIGILEVYSRQESPAMLNSILLRLRSAPPCSSSTQIGD